MDESPFHVQSDNRTEPWVTTMLRSSLANAREPYSEMREPGPDVSEASKPYASLLQLLTSTAKQFRNDNNDECHQHQQWQWSDDKASQQHCALDGDELETTFSSETDKSDHLHVPGIFIHEMVRFP